MRHGFNHHHKGLGFVAYQEFTWAGLKHIKRVSVLTVLQLHTGSCGVLCVEWIVHGSSMNWPYAFPCGKGLNYTAST